MDTYGALYAFAVKVDGALFLARLVHLDFDLFAVILCVETHSTSTGDEKEKKDAIVAVLA